MSIITSTLANFVLLRQRARYLHQFTTVLGTGRETSYRLPRVAPSTNVGLGPSPSPAKPAISDQFLNRDIDYGQKDGIEHGDEELLLNGGYLMSLNTTRFNEAMNFKDLNVYQGLLRSVQSAAGDQTVAFGGENATNKAIAPLTTRMIAAFDGRFRGEDNPAEELMYAASPLAGSLIRNIYEGQMQVAPSPLLQLGVTMAANVNGIPLLEFNSIPNRIVVPSAGNSSIASNTMTIPLGLGHPLLVGMRMTTSGGTTRNVEAPSPILTASETEVTVESTGAAVANNGPVTVLVDAAPVILFNRSKNFYAGPLTPNARIVDSSGDGGRAGGRELQVFSKFGVRSYDGFARMLLVPFPSETE